MQERSKDKITEAIIKAAIEIAQHNLLEEIHYNSDHCILGCRIIVEFAGSKDNLFLVTAEILDSEWELAQRLTKLFQSEVIALIDSHNKEYKDILKQEIEIMNDRCYS